MLIQNDVLKFSRLLSYIGCTDETICQIIDWNGKKLNISEINPDVASIHNWFIPKTAKVIPNLIETSPSIPIGFIDQLMASVKA